MDIHMNSLILQVITITEYLNLLLNRDVQEALSWSNT